MKKWFKNWGLGVVFIAVLLCFGGFTVNQLKAIIKTHEWISHTEQVLVGIKRVKINSLEVVSATSAYLAYKDDKLLTFYKKAHGDVFVDIQRLEILTEDNPKQTKRLGILNDTIFDKFEQADKVIRLRQNRGFDVAREEFRKGLFPDKLDEVRRLIDELEFEERRLLTERIKAADEETFRLIRLLILVTLTLLGIFAWFVHTYHSLEESTNKLNNIMKYSFDVICTMDKDGIFINVSDACNEIWGYEPEELIGTSYFALILPEDIRKTSIVAKAIMGGNPVNDFMNRYIRKDGTIITMMWSSHWVDDVLFCMGKDATQLETKKNELGRAYRTLDERNRAMESDLAMAREIQQMLLVQRSPTLVHQFDEKQVHLHLAHRYYLSEQLGGDLSYFLPISDTQVGILICDVMGHGVRSALISTIIRALAEDKAKDSAGPGEFLGHLNDKFISLVGHLEEVMFATAVYMVVDLEKLTVTYANAGHPAPLCVGRDEKRVKFIEESTYKPGPSLGLVEKAYFPEGVYSIEGNQLIVLFTDGIFEVKGETEDFDVDKLVELFHDNMNLSTEHLFDKIVSEIKDFAVSSKFEDDVCLIGIEISMTERKHNEIDTKTQSNDEKPKRRAYTRKHRTIEALEVPKESSETKGNPRDKGGGKAG